MDRNLTPRMSTPAVRNGALPDDGNPLLGNIPPVPSVQEAMHIVAESYLDHDLTGLSNSEIVVRQSRHAIVPNSQLAGIIVHLITLVRDSYRDRDLRTFEYRNHVLATNNFLHQRIVSARKSIPSCFGIAPFAKSRGLVVAIPAYMGRTALCDSIESLLKRELVSARVAVGDSLAEYPQLRVLRVQWPIGGDVSDFVHNFIGAFDSALNTDYINAARVPLFRDRDGVPAICSLGTAAHLGLLIVERINVENVSPPAADLTWNAIAQFTRTTGIPVLCLPSPGAAALSLTKLSGSVSDLTSSGVIEITRSPNASNSHWVAVCETQFDATLGVVDVGPMPAWFPEAAYELTLGYPGLLSKALTYIAQLLIRMNVSTFDQKMFKSQGKSALAIDLPHIEAVRTIRKLDKNSQRPVRFKPSSLLRHGDWLSFEELFPSHLMPEPL